MIRRKTIVLMGALLILGAGLWAQGVSAQSQDQNAAQNSVAARLQFRTLFVDENGDGICDFARDHDSDGIPNCQDPNWSKPEDGTGYQNRKGINADANRFGKQNGQQRKNVWSKQSFGQNQGNFGNGVSDGTGFKGRGQRGGRG